MPNYVVVCGVQDIPPGSGMVAEVEGKEVAVFNVDGTFYALDNMCLHQGGPLGEGELEGSIVTCPWHGWKYDVTNGINKVNQNLKVATYPVTVEGGHVKVSVS